eukprot:CAMPEP_0202466306 /NCGR_PEP_ID=MMETSP1360-20130828/68365_1 /ASSEMBLY_ACC=CAM_ASM_000848 /TAXON_ID=515479 /ORGANISM="Licmophora paradoxa, Strain CCMP2313" /LENGTH=37 /DNA_ID= /DNA_START= /DNA_END= /DNA_ORIENTATION=
MIEEQCYFADTVTEEELGFSNRGTCSSAWQQQQQQQQ